jgi:hypothetical protein
MTITEAKELVASEVSRTACEDIRYKYAVYESAYGGYGRYGFCFIPLNNKNGLMQR